MRYFFCCHSPVYQLNLADAFGYLGYVAVMVAKNFFKPGGNVLELFTTTGWLVATASLAGVGVAIFFFARHRQQWSSAPASA